jgi:hypothetical protein
MLCLITGLLIVLVLPFTCLLLPGLREWNSLRAKAQLQTVEYARLVANLAVKETVDQQFQTVGQQVYDSDSEHVTLSRFLRDLEALARHPNITPVNIKPMGTEQHRGYKTYHVKLTVSGKLPEILRFVCDATTSAAVTGLDCFSLRAINGVNLAECNLSLGMIRLAAQTNTTKPEPAHVP